MHYSGFLFDNIELVARRGSVQVDEELVDSGATLMCRTGLRMHSFDGT